MLGLAGSLRVRVALAAALCVVLPARAARLAFVVGNDNYQNVEKLRNAGADAETMAKAFARAGYQVTIRRDLDFKSFKDEFRAFRSRIQGGDEVLLYYSGHGVGFEGTNYLLPTDVRAESQEQVRDDAIALTTVQEDIAATRPRFTLVIVDACRDNPFPKVGRAIGDKGLARPIGARGQMVMYSAAEGQQALDRLGESDPVRNGVFARVFAKEMERPGVPVDQVLKAVRIEVNRLARSVKRDQIPALYSEVLDDYYFYPPDDRAARARPEPTSAAPVAAAPRPRTEVAAVARLPAPVPEPDTSQLDAAIDNRFMGWAATWGIDRYIPGSAHVASKECKGVACNANGHFTFARFGIPYSIAFSAELDKGAVVRLCYVDSTTARKDCVN